MKQIFNGRFGSFQEGKKIIKVSRGNDWRMWIYADFGDGGGYAALEKRYPVDFRDKVLSRYLQWEYWGFPGKK